MIPGASRVYAADLAVALSLAGNGQICLADTIPCFCLLRHDFELFCAVRAAAFGAKRPLATVANSLNDHYRKSRFMQKRIRQAHFSAASRTSVAHQ